MTANTATSDDTHSPDHVDRTRRRRLAHSKDTQVPTATAADVTLLLPTWRPEDDTPELTPLKGAAARRTTTSFSESPVVGSEDETTVLHTVGIDLKGCPS